MRIVLFMCEVSLCGDCRQKICQWNERKEKNAQPQRKKKNCYGFCHSSNRPAFALSIKQIFQRIFFSFRVTGNKWCEWRCSAVIFHTSSLAISFSLTHLFHSRIGAIENQLDFIHSGMFGGLLFSRFLLHLRYSFFFFFSFIWLCLKLPYISCSSGFWFLLMFAMRLDHYGKQKDNRLT